AIVQIRRDDAKLRSQLEHIPPLLTKHANRRQTIGGRHGIELQRQQLHQRRLAGAVGSEDGGVFAGANAEGQRVEHASAAEDDAGVVELEDVQGALLAAAAAVERVPSSRSMSVIAAGSL